jgi:ABC-type lipoprotein release transport system permease subunit
MFTLFRDLLHASRTLVKARAFTAVCVTSLGLGLGAVIVALLAGIPSARRAAAVEPILAMRAE